MEGLTPMLPLESLTIHAFRGLREVELPALGRFNVLVGRNNSGKTTILEAIATHARPLQPSEWVEVVRRRDVASTRTSLLEGLRWIFPQPFEHMATTKISSTGTFPVREVISKLTERDVTLVATEEGEGGTRSGAELRLRAKVEGNDRMGSFATMFWEGQRVIANKAPQGLSLRVITITPFSHRTQREVEVLSEALFADLKPKILELVRIFDPEIEDFEILKRPRSESAVYLRHARLGKVPLSTFGDGMRRVLLMGVSLAMVKGGILLVDEIESAIHIEALDQSFRWLQRACRELDVQLFATTHSLEAVDALIAADDADDLVAYRLEQKDGKVRAKRFSHESLRVLREELGQEIRA